MTIRTILAILLIPVLFWSCSDKAKDGTETILIDHNYLSSVKNGIENKDPALLNAYSKLLEDAQVSLLADPMSVIDKKTLPPSGSKNDYASYSRYWWPNPDKPDGLPFIRRDGETNPNSQSLDFSDRQRLGDLARHSETLGLSYYFTEDDKYAIKVAELLRIWFIDQATRMNPNVNHAQIRPGHNEGSKSGVLDGRLLIQALEASLLIKQSGALSEKEQNELKEWARQYFVWLTTNPMALEEAEAKNNHGSFYDVQALYFALYTDHQKAAKEIATNFTKQRLHQQIKPDGSMPEEMARTRPLFYSMFNLHAMFVFAHLAEKLGINIWEGESEPSRLRKALDYITPYADAKNSWPKQAVKEVDRMDLFPILLMANQQYPDGHYLKMAEHLPIENRKNHRSNLALPLMR